MVAAQETPFPLVLTAWAVVVYSSRTRVSHSFFSDFVAQSMRPPSTAHSEKLTSTRRLRGGGGGEGCVRRARRAPSAERAGLEMARARKRAILLVGLVGVLYQSKSSFFYTLLLRLPLTVLTS